MDGNIGKEGNKEEIVFRPQRRSLSTTFCMRCDRYVYLVMPEETKELFPGSWARLLSLAERGVVHRIHDSEGWIRLCFNSLKLEETKVQRHFVTLKPLWI